MLGTNGHVRGKASSAPMSAGVQLHEADLERLLTGSEAEMLAEVQRSLFEDAESIGACMCKAEHTTKPAGS